MFYIVYERKIPCSIFQNLCTVKMQFLEPISTECKKSSVGASREEIFQFIEELPPKIMISSFLKSTFGLTQTIKSISGRMKYHKF